MYSTYLKQIENIYKLISEMKSCFPTYYSFVNNNALAKLSLVGICNTGNFQPLQIKHRYIWTALTIAVFLRERENNIGCLQNREIKVISVFPAL